MRVPDSNTFSFRDVCDAVYPGLGYAGKELGQAFADANGIFNSAYVGNKDRLGNFRDYAQYYLDIQTQSMYFPLAGGAQYNIVDTDYPSLGFYCPDSGSWVNLTWYGGTLEVYCAELAYGSRYSSISIYSDSTVIGTIYISQDNSQGS